MEKLAIFKSFTKLQYTPLPTQDQPEVDPGSPFKDEEQQLPSSRPPIRPSRRLRKKRPSENAESSSSKSLFLPNVRIIAWLALGIICTFVIVFIFMPSPTKHHEYPSKATHHINHPHEKPHHDEAHDRPKQIPHEPECGRTPAEARQRGCIFEQQLGAWVPTTCAWSEIVDQFHDITGDIYLEWEWFTDTDLTQKVPPSEVSQLQSGNFSAIYTTYPRAHDLHCLYCWRKVEYAIEHGIGWMDARCHQFWHTKHCITLVAQTLTEQAEQHKALTYPLLFHDCVPLTSTKES
ncbi:hypothetical protein CcaCcLH18_12541 [Colletotrichum camelliae]|nr:hypothetical protein CcaCcLH18_12541 [Colletotrichum camelliae]